MARGKAQTAQAIPSACASCCSTKFAFGRSLHSRCMKAVLVRNPGSNARLLTGWELKPGATNAANDATGATHRMADSSDHTAGAGSEIVMQNNPDGNLDVLFSRTCAIGDSLMAQALSGKVAHPRNRGFSNDSSDSSKPGPEWVPGTVTLAPSHCRQGDESQFSFAPPSWRRQALTPPRPHRSPAPAAAPARPPRLAGRAGTCQAPERLTRWWPGRHKT